MGTVAGSIGEGTLLVLPPALEGDGGAELGVGLARWWCRQFKAAGRKTNWFVLGTTTAEGQRRLLALDDWEGARVGEQLTTRLGTRFGLAPKLGIDGARIELHARLFEVVDGGVRGIDEWQLHGRQVELPQFAFELVCAVSLRIGARPQPSTWQEAFDTHDPIAAIWYLVAVGAVALLEEGYLPDAEPAVDPLLRAYAGAPDMQPAIDYMDELLQAMATRPGSSELELAGVLRRAREALGHSPPAWDGLVQRVLSRAPG